MSIYSTIPLAIFKPTWLYIKRHNITGLKYFGKTTKTNPYTYKGSGKYWKQHLRLHGNDVSTQWVQLFTNRDELISYALSFSHENNISESPEWANLKPENGLDGKLPGLLTGPLPTSTKQKISSALKGKKGTFSGLTHTDESKRKMSVAKKGRHFTDQHKQNLSAAKRNITEETKQKISQSKKGKPISEQTKQKMAEAQRLRRYREKLK